MWINRSFHFIVRAPAGVQYFMGLPTRNWWCYLIPLLPTGSYTWPLNRKFENSVQVNLLVFNSWILEYLSFSSQYLLQTKLKWLSFLLQYLSGIFNRFSPGCLQKSGKNKYFSYTDVWMLKSCQDDFGIRWLYIYRHWQILPFTFLKFYPY